MASKSPLEEERNQPQSSERSAAERAMGFEVLPEFERFRQKDDAFCRSHWDPEVKSEKSKTFYETYSKPLEKFRKTEGFKQKDYALRNASWRVTDIFAEMKAAMDRREGFLDPFTTNLNQSDTAQIMDDPPAAAAEIKRVAKLFGADLAGITESDPRWNYLTSYSREDRREKPNELPEDLPHVIVLATEMDFDLVQTVPSALSGTATGLGYSRDSVALLSLAQYIRNLGYRAVASMNDSALAIPLAVKAGLGEYGRNGLLITKDFGPRVRLGKVFTDMPLAHDQPISFGVKEFCEVCRQCSGACPVKAIAPGPPDGAQHNRSNLKGVRKWNTDGEKCFRFWANQNSDCSICIRVCPYNKIYAKWIYRIGRFLAGTRLRRWMLKLDIWLGYGKRKTAKWWWRKN